MQENIFRGRFRVGRFHLWQEVLIVWAALYFFSFVILLLTGNPNLFPTVVLLGSFMVPVTFVAFFYGNRIGNRLSLPALGISFFYGGVISILLAALIEPIFIRELTFLTLLAVGLIEETTKMVGTLAVTSNRRHISLQNGIIFGAAVGMGFAALESSGYSFVAFLESQGSLSATVIVTLVRAFLSPVGHGTWTGILGGMIFRESKPYHFRFDSKVILTLLGVSLLHGLWNASPFIANSLVSLLMEIVIAVIGLYFLYRLWEEGKMSEV